MPFELTNAPTTFQSLMNTIFKPYLHKFFLVLFYDILVYSMSLSEHLIHLKAIFNILLQQQLYAKLFKYSFGCLEIEYLCHLISHSSVKVNPKK